MRHRTEEDRNGFISGYKANKHLVSMILFSDMTSEKEAVLAVLDRLST